MKVADHVPLIRAQDRCVRILTLEDAILFVDRPPCPERPHYWTAVYESHWKAAMKDLLHAQRIVIYVDEDGAYRIALTQRGLEDARDRRLS